MNAELAGSSENRRVPSGPPVGVVVAEGDAVAVLVCVGIGVVLGDAVRVGDGVRVVVALAVGTSVAVGVTLRVGLDVETRVPVVVASLVGLDVGVVVTVAVAVLVAVADTSIVGVPVAGGVTLGVALFEGSGDRLGVTDAEASSVGVTEAVTFGVCVGCASEGDGVSGAVAVSDAVTVGVSVAAQPCNAALTARTRSSTVTRPSALESALAHTVNGACANAMRTAVTSSSMLTTGLPSQSPGHAADTTELNPNSSTPTIPNNRRIGSTLQ